MSKIFKVQRNQQIADIYEATDLSQWDIANIFGVDQSTVSRAINLMSGE
tara:strand:+ start:452 stop:598 length:147 start_codon:yes stop_codon:yes gene_type:complete